MFGLRREMIAITILIVVLVIPAHTLAGGLALYALLLFWGHRWLTGVPLLP